MKPIIKVENLGKKYHIGAPKGSYVTIRETLAGALRAPLKRFRSNGKASYETIWALKDVNFEVMPGEVLGIVGRNGAGKSTLLKILSRITEPTTGRVELFGRVGSLLEVGTGFHPELTGRENVYLNGAILGMSYREIDRRFDEIVAFAEIERFLDTPVKHYSSGMYMRLAFAVAAHLQPEILIVDEVLAVGDAAFQKKCLGKMEDVSEKEGRTVILVTHSMAMITSLCTKAILLEEGKLVRSGTPLEVVPEYTTQGFLPPAYVDFRKWTKRVGDDYAELLECSVRNSTGEIAGEFDIREPVEVSMRYRILTPKAIKSFYTYPLFNLCSGTGEVVFSAMPKNNELGELEPGEYVATCFIPGNFLNNLTYFVSLSLASCDDGIKGHFYQENVMSFQVSEQVDETVYETRNGYPGAFGGSTRPKFEWKLEKTANA